MPDIVFYWRRRWFAARSLTAAALVCCAQPNSGGDEGVAGEITLRITMESGQAGPARSVMPGSSWTEPVAGWELSLYDTDRDTPFQQNYFQRGQDILFSLREAKPIRVKAAGYAVWESGRPSGTKLLETRAFLEFTVEQVRSGQVSVKVEPLADAVEGTSGNIDLQVKWDTVNTPALTRLKAALKDSDGNAISIGLNYNSVTVSDGSSVDITAGGKEAQIQANEVPAGWYTLVLTFYKDVNGDDVAAGIFHESVTVWPGTTANSWIRPSVNGMGGGSYQYMNITEADFASARANVLSIKVYKDSETNAVLDMATADTGETLLFPAHAIFSASSLRFVIDFFAPGDAPTGAGIYETVLINNDRTSRTLPGSYGYPHPQAYPYYYVYEFTLEATDIGHIAAGGALKITARAPDFFTRKTYTLTSSVAAARNYAGTAVYYPTLSAAIDAASGTEGAPDTITVLRDIGLDNEEIAAIAAAWPAGTNKHIKLTPTGITRTLKRITANTGAFFTVGSGSSLTLEGNGTGKLILDGGAVWTGSTPATLPEGMTSDDFPSPAFGAENVSGINASGPLVAVNSGGAFTMNAGAVLQNNNYNSRGGGVYVNSGGTFTMNGGAVVKGNRSLRNGGGVFVTAGGTFTMSGGTISGNTATQSGGGVHVNGNGNGAFTMFGGTINGNTATINGDGVCFSNGTFTMSDAAVINANNDVFLPS
ncbi:MAG: hypothetical protein LBG74_02045, partial [Spirochaetaceae bacterium]|nr:hypothetical protein [Spirochaetaceae bacterium]